MISINYLIDVFTLADDEFDRRVIAGEPVREVVQRAENAVMRLIEVDPATPDEADRKDAVLSRVMAEGLFPALGGRNSEAPASGHWCQSVRIS